MKYGGVGGWRAIKRISRDANIADAVPPYSYRTRYAKAGSRTAPLAQEDFGWKWQNVLHDLQRHAMDMLAFKSNAITTLQMMEIRAELNKLLDLVNSALVQRPGFWASFFGRERAWILRTQPQIQELLDSAERQYRYLLALAQSREKDQAKENDLINAFGKDIQALYIDPIHDRLSKDEQASLRKYDEDIEALNAAVIQDWDEMIVLRMALLDSLAEHSQAALGLFAKYQGEAQLPFNWDAERRVIIAGMVRLDLADRSPKGPKRKATPARNKFKAAKRKPRCT
jgi:hypothetical protein